MSGSTGAPVPPDHPEHDALADLAADVLPEELSQRVQAHVIGCTSCAELLAEAEGIRSLLRRSEPETMPDVVLARLEAALITARREDEAAAGDPSRSGAAGSRAGDAVAAKQRGRPPGSKADPNRRIKRSGASSGQLPVVATVGGASSRLSRMARPVQSARRQALEEQRADRPSRLGPLLRVAAGVIVVLGAGALTLNLAQRGGGASDTAASTSGGESSGTAAAPVLAPVQSTGTNYAESDLTGQVKTLIATSSQLRIAGSDGGEGSGLKSQSGPASAQAAPPGSTASDPTESDKSGGTSSEVRRSAAGQQLLRSPAALRACLDAIGAQGQQPAAVDLARYAGREAAIIVLPASGGKYDVWVVARDCRPANDGTIAFNTVTP